MSDSNVQTQTPTAAPNPQPAAPEAKTFTQRFQEMERMTQQNSFVLNFHNQIVQNLMQMVQSQNNDIVSLKETINAMLKLGDQSSEINSVNTVNKMTEVQAENHKKALQGEVEKGTIKAIDAVVGDDSIVSFSSADIVFGYNLVSAFQDENLKKQMVGAKVGDKVGEYTLSGIYEQVSTKPQGEVDEQASQESTTAQH